MSDNQAPSAAPSGPPTPDQGEPRGGAGVQGSGRPRGRRWLWGSLRLLLGAAFQLLLLVLLLLGLILGTQTGLRTALAVVQDLAPGLIRVGQVEGRVLGRLHLEDLEVRLPDLDLTLGRLDLDWTPLAALTGTLPIHRLRVQDIDLTLTPSEEKEREPLVLPEVVLPLGLEIDEALVERLRVFERGTEAPVFVLDRAALAAALKGGSLDLRRLEAELPEPRLSARASGQAELRDRYPLGLDLTWELESPPWGPP